MWDVVGERRAASAKVVQIPVTFPANDFDEGPHALGPRRSRHVGARSASRSTSPPSSTFETSGSNEFSIEVVQLEDNRGVIETEVVGPPNKLFGDPPFISQPDDDHGRGRPAVDRDRPRRAEAFTLRAGQWTRLGRVHVPVQSARLRCKGISRFHPHLRPAGSAALPFADQLRPARTSRRASGSRRLRNGRASSRRSTGASRRWDGRSTPGRSPRASRASRCSGTTWSGRSSSSGRCTIEFLEERRRPARPAVRVHRSGRPRLLAVRRSGASGVRPGARAASGAPGLLKSYQLMDAIVGEAMAAADKQGAALIVMSDHGFATWRRSINYNTWLAQNGYLALRTGVQTERSQPRDPLRLRESSGRTSTGRRRAPTPSASGTSTSTSKGREAQGTVRPGAEYEALKQELKGKLEAIVDPENGEKPVSRVVTREEAYSKFDPNLIPDLFVTNNPGYRVSWQTSLGGVQKDLFTVNDRVWSGDHCSLDPEKVKGIFFYNRKLDDRPRTLHRRHLPTVLDLFGLEAAVRAGRGGAEAKRGLESRSPFSVLRLLQGSRVPLPFLRTRETSLSSAGARTSESENQTLNRTSLSATIPPPHGLQISPRTSPENPRIH